ncbi:hypothetical protein A3H85_02740 [Candidatus Daviesbacteria bacterium RIFCSPLOWO2_02_FULL_40_8]|uniref:Uncharacterized protein n=1 Tax=Candidatus Daviesbacteria bacterium RIFCSPLOWO2_01_FULL_40_24 TaxID=1797787 RepID=A0A1F5MIH6_9BACT|nr:MAG: hypothetical protein A2780_03465 [Candidatus Daviesbacteria bacterium RIFCSPHIGHO2_01_FULL_41_45]OGE34203.1 MAG: hypothetical protein A3C32_00550 [Candidatus Daviesbacteria bacterium RIFCSPHIGHO2_02_FULL_41_14]OGE65187.1 MAG: hypothetical protein A3B49_01500 [Candidatus Daviesbacteria bacterium RIFCSPLOWO2_01_FULL_40_24]OGE66890.1 MAG: hypothetical protein A3H85_02740 [Candidatus Daviesbacteria bacterium RIFCSPLOWO2_02_FULL_40_8]
MNNERKFIAGYGIDNQDPARDPSGGHPGYIFDGHSGTIIPLEDYRIRHEQPDSDVFTITPEQLRMIRDINR